MPFGERFTEAIERMDAANGEDPRTEDVEGKSEPRELLFARRTYAWIEKLCDAPSEALLLAARGHTLCRWEIPRDRYELTTAAYHDWRRALAEHHADRAAAILAEVGYPQDTIDRVSSLITKKDWMNEVEGRALEDADCLVFLETKLGDYVDEWDDAKMFRVISGTLNKMTDGGRQQIEHLNLGERELEVLKPHAAS